MLVSAACYHSAGVMMRLRFAAIVELLQITIRYAWAFRDLFYWFPINLPILSFSCSHSFNRSPFYQYFTYLQYQFRGHAQHCAFGVICTGTTEVRTTSVRVRCVVELNHTHPFMCSKASASHSLFQIIHSLCGKLWTNIFGQIPDNILRVFLLNEMWRFCLDNFSMNEKILWLADG